ncbi:MAG: ATP-dependent protease LonB [Clostridium sp.]|uniref:ATP-dependent protease LonB n=1 Tax=Clostridium sp. TaxID=1506 RepID=UPI002A850932|nr:ATP-dependent protease LonB [Clostridium sp.]MDY5098374.1 ATP-dependent protease LonB [Clostridium sp.]
MVEVFMILQFVLTVVMGLYFFNALKGQKSQKTVIDRENKKEMTKLMVMRNIKLTEPLAEKSRPAAFSEIVGQEKGIRALKAALCGPNPQHVIIYGPPGVGKTAAARLVLEEARNNIYSPFKDNAKFIEIDATTIRFDDRGIADPLIGSVHDPIYQGAGSLGIAGIPQPKPGAVTKAHGGILFIDEIGELHPIELNKLLKVMEDRKVFLDSAYYSSEDPNMPNYIKEIFDNGLPADFRLIGATTRNPEDIPPAIRSRCVEIYFRALLSDEIEEIALNVIKKVNLSIEDGALSLLSRYCTNGREVVNLVQLCVGIATNDDRMEIGIEDVEWVIENGQYSPRPEKSIENEPRVGYVNGLAVYGANMGTLLEVEATSHRCEAGKGRLRVTGIIEEEEFGSSTKKSKRKSTAGCSIENVLSVLENNFGIQCDNYDLHINFPGGMPVDGPSAGITIATALYSAINNLLVNNKVAMTGEISLQGFVKPIGGVTAKINAAKKAGAEIIIIPKENWSESFGRIDGVKIVPVEKIEEVLRLAMMQETVQEYSLAKKESLHFGIPSGKAINGEF